MLHSYADLKTYAIRAEDERTGRVEDMYFDDETWTIRYLVVHTGFLLSARQSLIGVDLLGDPDTRHEEFPVKMTAADIEAAPPPESDLPVRDQPEDWPKPFPAPMPWPSFLVGMREASYTPLTAAEQIASTHRGEGESQDKHLRSMHEVSGYKVIAKDTDFGSVVDFLIDPEDWRVRLVVIDTGTWLPGQRVVLTIDHVTDIDAVAHAITVDVAMAEVENAPRLDSVDELKRSTSQEIMDRYGAYGMWPVGL